MRPQNAISTIGLRKAYGDVTVLDGVDLQARSGTVFALLGPNGAGKTTIVHILSTLVRADDGKIEVVARRAVRHEPAPAS